MLERLTWKCHICGEERPDDRISVRTIDRSAEMGLPPGTFQENIRYCNDNAECVERSKTFRFLKEKAKA